ncbi:hypothetical protein J4464_03010 [Candidatus Woesearchaeota archaeon]|nr:hypothetical protein [Candidatus Woesearchaeota archaeon]
MNESITIPWVAHAPYFLGAYPDRLNELGIQVEWIHTASDALERFRSGNPVPPMIITGLHISPGASPEFKDFAGDRSLMPFETGLELIRRIRHIPGYEHTPLVAIDAILEQNDAYASDITDECVRAGADEYHCTLNYTPSDLAARVTQLIPQP